MDNFIFSHKINTIESIINIIKDGSINSGSQVNPEYRLLSGGEPKKYVFTTILTQKLLDAPMTHSTPALLISPKILKNKKMIFNKMWQGDMTKDSIKLNPKENNKNKLIKINKIINKTLEKQDVGWPFNNEALFYKNIKLKYVYGIVIPKKYFKQISKIIPDNIKLYTSYSTAFNDFFQDLQ